jgi:hypothetical protein
MSMPLIHGVAAIIAIYTQTIAASEAIEIREGTQAIFDRCRVAVGEVSSDGAELDTFEERALIETTQIVRKGQVLFMCGGLHRVLDLAQRPSNGLPGGNRGTVSIAPSAVRTPKLHSGTVVLTIGGEIAQFGPQRAILSELALASTASGRTARFTVRLDHGETRVSSVAGGFVTIGAERHRIIAVTPPNKATGVPGWVEIALQPQPQVTRRCKR